MPRDNGACPHCGESMNGEPIEGLPGRFYDQRVQVETAGEKEPLFWRCPFCGFKWPRYPSGKLHDRALHIMAAEATSARRT